MATVTPPKDFGFGSDEEMLRDLARKFLDEQLPIEKLRNLVSQDHNAVYERGELQRWDPELWKQMSELGWNGLAIPESAGGVGFSLVGIAGLVEELGRHAVPSPFLSTLNASFVLRAVDAEAAGPTLSRIVDGAAASLAITNAEGNWEPAVCGVTARAASGGDILLSGRAHFVQDASKAELFVTAADAGDARLLCVVPADAPGLGLTPDHIHDLTRDQATLHFDEVQVPASAILSRDATEVLERAWPSLLISTAADLCGTSEWQLQTTVEYARNRVQFDHLLGFFQAVKHPLVNAMIAIDRARSLLFHAACCVDQASDEALAAARMAKSAASDAGAFISDRSVQLHGGIGFTWECDVHLFFKRSMHNQALYGDASYQRRKLAELLIGPA